MNKASLDISFQGVLSCLHSREISSYLTRTFIYDLINNGLGEKPRLFVFYENEGDRKFALGGLFQRYNVRKIDGFYECEGMKIFLEVKPRNIPADFHHMDYDPQTGEIYNRATGLPYKEEELQMFRCTEVQSPGCSWFCC